MYNPINCRFPVLLLAINLVCFSPVMAQAPSDAIAQNHTLAAPAPSATPEVTPAPTSGDEAFAQPSFPGGQTAMLSFLNKNLHYPAEAQEKGVQGRVMVTFWVDEQGRTYGHGALQSPDPALAAEALRVARLMPAWTPGRQEGRIQPMMVYMPVVFKLANR